MNKTTTKNICVLLTLATIFASIFTLVACNKQKEWKLTDIYVQSTSPQEFTSYKQEMTLPAGWQVYTTSKTSNSTTQADNVNSDVGYVKALNAFIISSKDSANETCLSIVKCDDEKVYFDGGMKGMMFPQSSGISALRVKDGLIAVKFKNGEACVYDANAKIVLSRTKTHNISVTIDKAIKILDGGLIAVGYAYDVNGSKGYTSIYRPSTDGAVSSRGQLVCRVQNEDNDLSYVNGFDSKYVSVVGNDEGSYMFAIPQRASQSVQNLKVEKEKGLVADNGKDEYYSELTYIGDGKFFVHEDWIVDKDEEYTYFDGEKYYMVSRHVYRADKQEFKEYTDNSTKIFTGITNRYYDSTKAGMDTRDLLNAGFSYVSYGIDINLEEGVNVGHYDQFVLDSDLNIVLSLSGNYGINVKMQDKDEVGLLDLVMSITDGVMYVPYLPSNINYYDTDGNLLGSNNKYTVIAQNYSNGIAVAQASFTSGSTTTAAFGAFNQRGEVVIPFNYSALTAFRGFYAIGERKVDDKNKIFLVGKDGTEVERMSDNSEPLKDIAKSTQGAYMYKIGCYMFEQVIDGKSYFGIKNFNQNVEKNLIMNARMTAGCTLYSPPSSTVDVFVFEKITASDNSVSYTIYRII